jgi:hypothetical protein
MIKKIIIGSSAFLVPVVVFAQLTIGEKNLTGVLKFINNILNTATGLIVALAVVYVLWGIFEYVKAGDDDKRTEGRNKMVYGIIGIAVMVSLWGLVKVITNTFGLDNSATLNAPPIPPISF